MEIDKFLKTPFAVPIRPEYILSLSAIWCHLIYHVDQAFRTYAFYALVLCFITLVFQAYRGFTFKIRFTLKDLLIFLGFIVFNLALHNSYMFYSLAGDEL